jgi:hypothetical protein
MAVALQTEFSFTLPCGFVDETGTLHKGGVMRMATALDEVQPLQDARVNANHAYIGVLLLSRVVTRLGSIAPVPSAVIERLFAADFAYLQDMYMRVNQPRAKSRKRSARIVARGLASSCRVAEEATSSTTAAPESAQASSEVDIDRLADLVYRLIARDIRLGLARGERPLSRLGTGRRSS